jgi:NAD(P)-dependent dehydrogenase (short-subunit alcohol dehydrogenase family)
MQLPQTPSFQLSGKRALVTGASSGIGLACAVALADVGAKVTIAARRTQKLIELQTQMLAKGWQVEVLALDIAKVEQTQEILSKLAPFDVLVNSAGYAKHTKALETTVADFDDVMAVNLRGAYFLTQAVAKGLIAASKGGSLINISSQMAKVGGIERAAYCASKHALEGFTKAMAIEWGPNKIRVNTICPTFILTDLTQPTFDQPAKKAWIEDMIKLDRVGEVQDIMGAVVYLASDASALMTGTAMLVDGGWTAG